MSALENNHPLVSQMESLLKQCELHAVYEPEEGEPFSDCYMAAVDLFGWQTYRVYFRIEDDGELNVVHLERWHFG